jgi:hypothetical protein
MQALACRSARAGVQEGEAVEPTVRKCSAMFSVWQKSTDGQEKGAMELLLQRPWPSWAQRPICELHGMDGEASTTNVRLFESTTNMLPFRAPQA